jgi:hypothetical protein
VGGALASERLMEPRIQYAKTSDGVNIAYAVFGEGPAIVFRPPSGGTYTVIFHAPWCGKTTTGWPRWAGR